MMFWAVLLLLFVPMLAGCTGAAAQNADDVLRIGFVAPPSQRVAHLERSAVALAFSEANARKLLGARKIVLNDDYVPGDLAVIAGGPSVEESRIGFQVAFVSLSLEKSGSSLQPMRSLDCNSKNLTLPCDDADLKGRRRLFAARFAAFARERPIAQSYIAYAEAQALILAAQRLLAEEQLSYVALRRALLYGEFSTVAGKLRFAVPPEMIDAME